MIHTRLKKQANRFYYPVRLEHWGILMIRLKPREIHPR
jgi:hypothetical protein